MDRHLMADLAACLDWYDGEASAHLPDGVRGRTLADSLRAAVIDCDDRAKGRAFPWLDGVREQLGNSRGELLTLPGGAAFDIDPAVQLADVAATLIGGAVGGFVGLTSMTDKQLADGVEKAAKLIELARKRVTPPPTPPATAAVNGGPHTADSVKSDGPPDFDAATTYFEWLVARGGEAGYGERPQAMTDQQAADARRALIKRGVVAYTGVGPAVGLTKHGREVADSLFPSVKLAMQPLKLGEQDDAA